MSTLRDIKRRIRAVNNTRQITKAMKMVAAAKLRKSQTRMLQLRPYAEKMASVLRNIATVSDGEAHPLLVMRPRRIIEVVVITSDRGLCGSFNTNIIKTASNFISKSMTDGFNVSVSCVGKKAVDYFKRRDTALRHSWTGLSGRITYANAQEVAANVIEAYTGGVIDEVFLIYNEFKSVIKQRVSIVRILPIASVEPKDSGEESADAPDTGIYEPSQDEVFRELLPKNIEIQIFRALLESQASEEAARMTAMGNATQNANEMIGRLTLQYNKARQASITKELMDIVGGVEALK